MASMSLAHLHLSAPSLIEAGEPMSAWRTFLREPKSGLSEPAARLHVLDLFSGVGGLALGFARAAERHTIEAVSQGAVDTDSGALEVYRRNLGTVHSIVASVPSLVDFQVRGQGESARFLYPPELIGAAAAGKLGNVDVVLAGPPCQGNSSLNNKTRGDDPRNRLYLTAPAVAIAAGARTLIIENVSGVVRARGNFVDTAIRLLQEAGFSVCTGLFAAHELGWPQTRKRFFLVASRDRDPLPIAEVSASLRRPPLPVSWAIDDLLDAADDDLMHTVAELSDENAERIRWLFKHNEYNMPNNLRPDCHKDGTSYGAVYGRMRWDKPAPTITTGFLTPGRGRFIHPQRPRTITPREAARIQGFPDWFDFIAPESVGGTRRGLAKWIGNAVPSILGFAAGVSAFGSPKGA